MQQAHHLGTASVVKCFFELRRKLLQRSLMIAGYHQGLGHAASSDRDDVRLYVQSSYEARLGSMSHPA